MTLGYIEGVLAASAAHTASFSTPALTNAEGRNYLTVSVFISACTSGISIVPKIEAFDTASQTWYTVLTGVAITAVTTAPQVLTVSPGATDVSNVTINAGVPRQFRVTMTAADAKSATYVIGYSLSTRNAS